MSACCSGGRRTPPWAAVPCRQMVTQSWKNIPPILANKSPETPSVFLPAALLREARRQKQLNTADVPAVCILDPDGDILRRLKASGRARPFEAWPCYHTELNTFSLAGQTVGIVGCV